MYRPDESDHITASPYHKHKKKIHKACKIKLFLVLNGVFYHERCLFKEHIQATTESLENKLNCKSHYIKYMALPVGEKFHSVPKG